jgi:hypothetical protein
VLLVWIDRCLPYRIAAYVIYCLKWLNWPVWIPSFLLRALFFIIWIIWFLWTYILYPSVLEHDISKYLPAIRHWIALIVWQFPRRIAPQRPIVYEWNFFAIHIWRNLNFDHPWPPFIGSLAFRSIKVVNGKVYNWCILSNFFSIDDSIPLLDNFIQALHYPVQIMSIMEIRCLIVIHLKQHFRFQNQIFIFVAKTELCFFKFRWIYIPPYSFKSFKALNRVT